MAFRNRLWKNVCFIVSAVAFCTSLEAGVTLPDLDSASQRRAEVRTARLYEAKWGVFTHFLSYGCKTPEEWNARVDGFDVKRMVGQVKRVGARFYFMTIMQGQRFLLGPNATYDRYTGLNPGEGCSRRDLVVELSEELDRAGIDLYLYFTGDGPWADKELAPKFGFAPRRENVPDVFVEKWAAVLKEYAVRYGDRVKGWWIDGAYRWFKYTDAQLQMYVDVVRCGNPSALIAFNEYGVTDYFQNSFVGADFTAGEFNDFTVLPHSRFVNGLQAFALIPLGDYKDPKSVGSSWDAPGLKHPADYTASFVKLFNMNGGIVAIDVHHDDKGGIDPQHLSVLEAVGKATRTITDVVSPEDVLPNSLSNRTEKEKQK